VCNQYYVAHDITIMIDQNHYVRDTNKFSDEIRYSFRSKRLPSSMKGKSTEIIASNVNFESSPEGFTLYSKYRCYKNFLFTRCYFSENESREAPTKNSSCKDALQCAQNLLISFFYFTFQDKLDNVFHTRTASIPARIHVWIFT